MITKKNWIVGIITASIVLVCLSIITSSTIPSANDKVNEVIKQEESKTKVITDENVEATSIKKAIGEEITLATLYKKITNF